MKLLTNRLVARATGSQWSKVASIYFLAALLILLTFWLRVHFGPYFMERPMMVLFVLPICVSAFLGGAGPGLFSTVLSAMLLAYFLVPPAGSFRMEHRYDEIQLIAFISGGLLISLFSELLRRARWDAGDMTRKIEEKEEQSRHILEVLSEGVVIQARDGSITWANASAEKLLGLQKHTLLGRTSSHPEWNSIREDGSPFPGHEHPAMVTLRTGEGFSNIMMGIRKPGNEEVWLSINTRPLVDHATGEIHAVVASFRDVTQSRNYEHALRESEALFRTYVEKSPVALMVANDQGIYIDGNPAAEQLFGYPLPEMLNRHVISMVAKEDQTRAAQQLGRVITEKQSVGEFRMIRKDGTEMWVLVMASRLSENRILGFCVDMSARHNAENLVRLQGAALQAAANAIVIADLAGRIEWVNPAFTALTGYSFADAIGKTHADLIKSGEQNKTFYQQLWSTIQGGGVWQGEIVNRRKDGSIYQEEMTITPVRDDAGVIRHYVAIKSDITERKKMEMRLLRAQRLESVGRMASGIAHDLNNILAPVLVAPDMLRDVVQDPEMRELIDSMETSAQRGSMIVRQLLMFGRGSETALAPVSIQPVIKEIIRLMQETFPRNIEVRFESCEEIMLVEGDSTQIHQLLVNLCVNARDAMPQGGVLWIKLDRVVVADKQCAAYAWVQAGPHAHLSVADTGTGIPAELQGKIFDPFFTTKPVGQGTGLGLSTALGITRTHRGFIEFDSKVGKGTTFHVYIPLVAASHHHVSEHPSVIAPEGGTESIFLVDDEAGIRKVLGEVLRRAGYHVDTAANGAEALKMLNANHGAYQLLLTDMMMPVMDGWSLIQHVRAQWPSMKIIAISGNLPDAQWVEQLRANVDGLLFKPCGKKLLLETVRNALDAARVDTSAGGSLPRT